MNTKRQSELDLTVQPDLDAQTARLEAAPESERWNPLAGSGGHQAPTNVSVDEDEAGRSANQQLVEEGIAKAEDNQVRQAEKAAAKAI